MRSRFTFVLLFLIGCVYSAKGQQKPVFSQYMFNGLALNPAFAGSQDQFSITGLYRNQWVNFEGAPTITTLSANTAIAGKRIGLGGILYHDKVGIHSDVGLYLSYAYRIRFQNGVLAMGLQAGFDNLRSDFTQLTLNNINDPNLSGVLSTFNPNFGSGLFYSTARFYVGVSVPYIINNKFFKRQEVFSEARSRRYYFLTAGRVFSINAVFQVKPSLLIRYQENAPLGIDLNTQLIILRKVSLGASYRSGDAFIGSFEFQFSENFRLGYAFDYTLSSISKFTRGTHELMINYRVDIPGIDRRIECPTFF